MEKTVFASNETKPIMLPQFLKSSMSSFVPETSSPSRSSCSGCRLDVQSGDVENSGVEGDRVVEKTVFASNKTKTIMLPRFLKSPLSSFVPVTSSPSKTSVSGCRLEVPTAPTLWIPT